MSATGAHPPSARARTLFAMLVLATTSATSASLSVRDARGDQWRAMSDPADGAQGYLLEHVFAGGQPDPRYGRGGRRSLAISATDDAPTSLRVDTRGRIWVSGASIAGGQPQAVVLRYLADGAPDLRWGVQGKLQISPGGLSVKPNDLLPLSDGSLLVAGVAANVEPARAVVFHLKADGSLDTSFGTAGTWQRVGATGASTATNLAADDDGAVAVCVTARGDTPAAEIWSIVGRAPRLVHEQALDPSIDGEDLRVAWAAGRWVLTSGSSSTLAGLAATLVPPLTTPTRGSLASASAPSDPGQGVFSPFAGDSSAPSLPPASRVDETGGGRVGLWIGSLLVVATLGMIAVRWSRRATQTVLRKRKL